MSLLTKGLSMRFARCNIQILSSNLQRAMGTALRVGADKRICTHLSLIQRSIRGFDSNVFLNSKGSALNHRVSSLVVSSGPKDEAINIEEFETLEKEFPENDIAGFSVFIEQDEGDLETKSKPADLKGVSKQNLWEENRELRQQKQEAEERVRRLEEENARLRSNSVPQDRINQERIQNGTMATFGFIATKIIFSLFRRAVSPI